MRLGFLFFALTFWLVAAAQQTLTNNLLLGYQEFPTIITSHTADGSGNQYYTGIFRGQLMVNNQVLTSGNGLEDIFWVKTNATGQVIRFKTYGSANSENSYTNSLAMGSSKMLFGLSSFENLQLGNFSFVPYTYATSSFASALVCTDTAGNPVWVRKTNLQNFRVFFTDNVFHVVGQLTASSPATKIDNVVVLDSIGRSGMVHLMLDEAGNFLSAKSITARKSGQSVSLANTSSFSDKGLYLHFRVDGDSSFYINQTAVALPINYGSYQMLMKVDTGYRSYRLKNLNPLRHQIAGFTNVMMPTTAANDSVYAVFACESNASTYFIDGIAQQQLRNTLYVFDSTLTLRRQVSLGSSLAGYYPTNVFKRRVFFRHLLYQNGQLFLNGVFTGINESPLNTITVKDTTLNILPGLSHTVDQNGPSKSFVAKCGLNGLSGTLQWYGDHREYENLNVAPAFVRPAGNNRIAFTQIADYVWNPWMIDENLNVLQGSMRKGVDLPESPQMIKYFNDGSRIVLGYARGKTALDSNGVFISNLSRRDVFVVRLSATNQVVWFRRFHSTLTNVEARGLEVKNDKAYFLVNYLGSQNDSNYIKVGTNVYSVRVNASLLASVDTAGALTVLNFADPIIRGAFLMNFSFFGNGDLLVATSTNPVPYLAFPLTFSPQLFRLKPTNGSVLEGRKLYGAGTIGIHTVQIDKNDQLYISGSSSYPSAYKMYLHNGTSTIDSLPVAGNTQPQPALLKMQWNSLGWMKRFSGNAFIRQLGDLVLAKDKPVMSVTSSAVNQPLYWEGQTIHNGFTAQAFSLVSINSDGSIAQKKSLVNFSSNYMRAGANGQVYVSGVLRSALQVDTIQIGFAGGIVDGIGLVLDSNITAKRSFRIASPFVESMTDMDIYSDSLVAIAYTGQTAPQLYLSRTTVATGDYEEDAYVGSINISNGIVTGIATPLPPFTYVTIAPNPVKDFIIRVTAQVTEPLRTTFAVYDSRGQFVSSSSVQLASGITRHAISLPAAISKGVYHVVVSNKKWTTTKVILVL